MSAFTHAAAEAGVPPALGYYGNVVQLVLPAPDMIQPGRDIPPCPHEYRPAQHWTNGPPA
jgi:hypothetical protein